MGHCSCISAIDAGAANGGRIARGIDFLGYHFLPPGLALAKQVITNFLTKTSRLYEQERGKPDGFPLLGAYTKRWMRWSRAGLTSRQSAEAMA